MVKLLKRTGHSTGRYLALVAVTATLAACGGGSSGDGTDDGDILEEPTVDLDEDGIDDAFDPFIDLDGDGRDDETNLSLGQTNFIPITATEPCGNDTGSDNNSSNDDWADNCLIRRTVDSGQGQFADSLYTVGVQRIIWCSGFDSDSPSGSYTAFADGEFGPGTELALTRFQGGEPNPIDTDGRVGPMTWGKLQDAITRLDQGQLITDPNDSTRSIVRDPFGFAEGRCAGTTLFYRVGLLDVESQSVIPGELGWLLAKNAPNEAQSVPFSIDSPFGGVLN